MVLHVTAEKLSSFRLGGFALALGPSITRRSRSSEFAARSAGGRSSRAQRGEEQVEIRTGVADVSLRTVRTVVAGTLDDAVEAAGAGKAIAQDSPFRRRGAPAIDCEPALREVGKAFRDEGVVVPAERKEARACRRVQSTSP